MSYVCLPPKLLIQKAGPRRKVSRTYTRLSALSKQMARATQVNLVKGIRKFRSRISPEAMFEAWKSGSYGSVLETVPWDKMPEDIEPAISGMYEGAVDAATNFVIPSLPAPIQDTLRFDTDNPRIRGFIDARTAELVNVNIQPTAKQVIQQSVQRSFEQALTPRQVADQIIGTIGLLPKQEAALRKYSYNLQIRNYPAASLQKLGAAYADRLLDQRAMMIARTETRMAFNRGQLSVWQQAAGQGLIDSATAKKVWVVDGDPCPICEPMDGVAVGLDEMWVIEDDNGPRSVEVPTESHPHCFCGMEMDFGDSEQKIEESAPPEEEPNDTLEE